MNYDDFLEKKKIDSHEYGFEAVDNLFCDRIKPHQKACVKWSCQRAKSALFLSTGLGKTLSQLEWAKQVVFKTQKPVLIVAPLAVSEQTFRESSKFGINSRVVKDASDINEAGIYITNYEKLQKFDCNVFSGVVLDESSILKGIQGKLRKFITECFLKTPYKLSCTATPSPNDFMELGTQSEFLGIMSQVEMLAMFFIHDGGETSKWRLKGHGKVKFWEWMATWSIYIKSPADLGFDGKEYELGKIEYFNYQIKTSPVDELFVVPAQGLMDRNKARKDTMVERCKKAAEIVNGLKENCVVWCHLNAESELLTSLIDGAVEVSGSTKPQDKIDAMIGFADNKIKCLVTKPKLAGFGMNWQSTRHAVFVGLSDSFEQYYQAIRRQWRFGQNKKVNVHIISADVEGAVVANIKRKEMQNDEMSSAMVKHMITLTKASINSAVSEKSEYHGNVDFIKPSF